MRHGTHLALLREARTCAANVVTIEDGLTLGGQGATTDGGGQTVIGRRGHSGVVIRNLALRNGVTTMQALRVGWPPAVM